MIQLVEFDAIVREPGRLETPENVKELRACVKWANEVIDSMQKMGILMDECIESYPVTDMEFAIKLSAMYEYTRCSSQWKKKTKKEK